MNNTKNKYRLVLTIYFTNAAYRDPLILTKFSSDELDDPMMYWKEQIEHIKRTEPNSMVIINTGDVTYSFIKGFFVGFRCEKFKRWF